MERLIFDDPDLAAQLFGPHNLHLEILAKASGAHIFNRGSTLCIETNDQDVASALTRLFCTLYDEVKEGLPLDIHALSGLFSLNMKLIAQRKLSETKAEARTKSESLALSAEGKKAEHKGSGKTSEKQSEKELPKKTTRKTSRPKNTDVPKTASDPTDQNETSLPASSTFTPIQTPKKTVIPRNASQQRYLELLQNYEIVFALGPAGTGKTYLAVAHAIALLHLHRIKKIILTRPAVEAGEKLGFLPGDLIEKINPYLRPLYDALYDMLPQARVAALSELGTIEIAPLAFMRGRTLNDSCIILDEAQNTTREQMKMFLTRMGFGSRMIITGDSTQIDLPPDSSGKVRQSGLIHARSILQAIPRIAFHTFTKEDVVRHQLVGEIVHAYDIAENRRPKD